VTSHGHGRGQRLAEHLIRRACRHLPDDARDERYREWTAELPAILHDPDIRPQARRTARALLYAADHTRGASRLPGSAASREHRVTRLALRYSPIYFPILGTAITVCTSALRVWHSWVLVLLLVVLVVTDAALAIHWRLLRIRNHPRRRRARARTP
jgi:hypothetical protein